MTTIPDLYKIFKESSGITTDSRKIEAGTIFFALKGDNFDGNKFAEQALLKGAEYAVIDDHNLKPNDRFIQVEDVLKTLQALATFHRRQFKIPVIGITGSNGKTTTKELLASILSSHYHTHFTKGNFNNHIGVPLTLLDLPQNTEVAVIEMGANHIGEIAALCEIAEPTHGVITNVGKAHLEGFGSVEGVRKGKSELYAYLGKHKGVAFINLDEPFLKDLAEEKVGRKVFYHKSEVPDAEVAPLETKMLAASPSVRVAFLSDRRDQLIEAESNLFGLYNFNNIQTATSIGRYFKVPALKIKAAIESYDPTNNRSQILQKGTNTYILDAYNANPTSMQIAIDNMDNLASDYKMIIIGDMLELGSYSEDEHRAILRHAERKSFDYLILVGEEFGKLAPESPSAIHFPNIETLKKWFDQQAIENTLILLKGSRGIRLEGLLN